MICDDLKASRPPLALRLLRVPRLVVTLQQPTEGVGWGGGGDDGPTLMGIFYFHLTAEAAADALSAEPSPATKLLARYFARAPTEEKVREA